MTERAAGAGIKMVIDQAELQNLMREVLARNMRLQPALKRMLVWQMRSTSKNFKAEGRPRAWRPLSPVTIKRRRKGKGKGRVRILRDTGIMAASVMGRAKGSITQITDTMLVYGTRIPYARKQQFGQQAKGQAALTVPAHVRLLKSGRHIRVRRYTMRGKQGRIPARPFLMFQTEDIKEHELILRDYILENKQR